MSAARLAAALGVVFLAAHLPFLAPTLEDIDSINFALGVQEFDVARHRPHPPGYPLFIALAKVSTPIAGSLGFPASTALAFWSAVPAAALVVLLFALFRQLDPHPWRPVWAAALAAACPLFWFTALRPLSDMAGLAGAVAAQACLVAALAVHEGGWPPGRALAAGGLLAGASIGLRSQTFVLTLPLFAVALIGARVPLRHRLAAVAAVTVGILAWAVPLLAASGGLAGYLAALGTQAGEDFSGVVMLWTVRSARVARDALLHTFVWPWGSLVAGGLVAALALAGAVRGLVRSTRETALLGVAFAPYAVFHLLFQETVTIRYALPLVVPVAFLAVRGLWLPWPGLSHAGAAALVAASLMAAIGPSRAYGRDGSPTFRLLADLAHERRDAAAVTAAHAVMRRAVQWAGPSLPGRVLTPPHGREWLAVVDVWKQQPGAAVRFVADPRRTDLAMFDPHARTLVRSYRWSFPELPFVGGARPGNADLYAMRPPGWMLERGWAMTPEIAGMTARDGLGPHIEPAVAWVTGVAPGSLLMIGGRHLGAPADPAARITLRSGEGILDAWDVTPGAFLRLIDLDPARFAGAGYQPVRVTATSADDSGRQVRVGLEQFDLQPAGRVMWGFAEGWNEPEFNPMSARSWRWMTGQGTLWIRPLGRALTLRLTGEAPLVYFDRPSTVRVIVGDRELARFTLSADFDQSVVIPAPLLDAAGGRVRVATDQTFVPAERGGAADRRQLGLRVYSLQVTGSVIPGP